MRNHGRAHPAPCVRPRCVCSVLRAHVLYSFAGLIRRTPLPTFSDTAITDRHSDTTIFQLRAYWVRIFWSVGSEKSFGHVPPVGVEPSTSCVNGDTLSTRPGAPRACTVFKSVTLSIACANCAFHVQAVHDVAWSR